MDKNIGLINDTDKLTILKSRPLYALWDSDLTLAEFKILDMYLGRIDSHNEENRVVVFEKGKIEELLGVTKINKPQLEKRLKHLMGNVVKIPDGDDKKGFRLVSLFEEAIAEQDEYGLWQVKMECTQKARKYIFNIDNIGYIRYKLRNVINLKSKYSYFMYLYVWDMKFRGTWEISLKELKELLGCDKEETYKEFKHFNNKILKKTQEEIHKETDIRFEYETVKRGRSVVGIRIHYLGQVALDDDVDKNRQVALDDVDKNQMTIEEWFEAEQKEVMTEYDFIKAQAEAWKEELPVGWFSQDEIELIAELLYKIPEHVLPSDRYADLPQKRVMYVREKILTMKMYDGKQTIKSKFKYIEKILREDA